MSLISRLFVKKNKQNTRNEDLNTSRPAVWNDFWFNGFEKPMSRAGQMVTATTAQRVAAVHACRQAICESFAMLPGSVMSEVDETKKETIKTHPLHKVLHDRPNQWMDPFVFYETMQGHLLDYGNAYAFIGRTNSKAIDRLVPLDPVRVHVDLVGGNLEYSYSDPMGASKRYKQNEIFHLRINSRDGIIGRSPITVAAETVGFSMALLEHGNKLFENGAFLSGLLKAPFPFKDDEARANFMRSFKEYFGSANSGKIALLEQGVEYQPFQMTNKDAQFLEAKDASVLDICRLFRVPPVMVQVTDKGMSYASVEQLFIIWVTNTIQPYSTRWEQACKFQLLTDKSEENMFVRFNISALLRGDLKSRTDAVIQQLQYGLRTINEARNLLDQNASDDPIADELLLSHNLIPASKIMKQENPFDEPQPSEEEPEEEGKEVEEIEKGLGAERWGKPTRDISQFKPLLMDLLGRLGRRERKAVEQASRSEAFIEKMEQFWSEHVKTVDETLGSAFIAAKAQHTVVSDFVQEYWEARTLELMQHKEKAYQDDESDKWADIALRKIGGYNGN